MKQEDGRSYFYQWELNQRLLVEENCTLVQFGNGTMSNALGVEVREQDGVRYAEIPNILLQTAADLHAYAWNEETTSVVGHSVFAVVAMPKPAQYAYTQTEVKRYDTLLKELQEKTAYYIPDVDETGNLSWRKGMESLPDVPQTNIRGPIGEKGETGNDGYTPQKGIDYFTDADKDEIMGKAWAAFTKSGATVTCEPAEGYPLSVISDIEPIQAGSGDPSPDNVRSISGYSAVKLTINDKQFTRSLGRTVYGGSLDWTTGVLTIDRVRYKFVGTEVFEQVGTAVAGKKRYRLRKVHNSFLRNARIPDNDGAVDDKLILSKLPTIPAANTYKNIDGIGSASSSEGAIFIYCEKYAEDFEGFKAMMKGAQLVYELAEPETVQLTPAQITALSGVNTLYSNTGDTEVTGRTYLLPLVEDLKERTSALEADNTKTLSKEEQKSACQRIGTLNVVENSNGTITVTMPSGKTKTVDLSLIEKIL